MKNKIKKSKIKQAIKEGKNSLKIPKTNPPYIRSA